LEEPTGRVGLKVVIFCGGLGMRLRKYSETIPKLMVAFGYRRILWHVMRYYAPLDEGLTRTVAWYKWQSSVGGNS
jgi:hypothetical protein